jgi:hypothetical protein
MNVENRTKHYGTLLQLKGKLDMMTRQIVAPADDESNVQPSKEALLGSRTHLKVLTVLMNYELLNFCSYCHKIIGNDKRSLTCFALTSAPWA